MTTTTQPSAVRGRRIIERPRLTKILDKSEARVILLVAPAGYGKTTLARQWARTLSGVAWVTCTQAHRDVAVLAEDFAQSFDPSGEAVSFVHQYVAAHGAPQQVSVSLAKALAKRAVALDSIQWLIVDDYHELLDSQGAEDFVATFEEIVGARVMIATRQRPTWASSRRMVYGEAEEIGREELAMDDAEAKSLVGKSSKLAKQAQGWPALLGLAAAAPDASPPGEVLPNALHQYFAEELFQRADSEMQRQLEEIALLSGFDRPTLEEVLALSEDFFEKATELGFFTSDDAPGLHPLLREFLLEKIVQRGSASADAERAINLCLAHEKWSTALALVGRFKRHDLIDTALRHSFMPLVRSGRIETLQNFGASVQIAHAFPAPSVDLVTAEVAFASGELELGSELAKRALSGLAAGHPLRSRALALQGQAQVFEFKNAEGEATFRQALEEAVTEPDAHEALFGLAMAGSYGESESLDTVIDELDRLRHKSPQDLVRAFTARLTQRRLKGDLSVHLPLAEAFDALKLVEDPRVRSSFAYTAGYSLALQARYVEAQASIEIALKDVEDFEIAYAAPYVRWGEAFVALGLRRFSVADRALQRLEDSAAAKHDAIHAFNARLLRIRLLLQSGEHAQALRLALLDDIPSPVAPSWEGEWHATRALTFAVAHMPSEAREAAEIALASSRMGDVTMLANVAIAVVDAEAGELETGATVLRRATETQIRDPLVCALRASMRLADGLGSATDCREQLEVLYRSTGDRGLARRAGFKLRAAESPSQLLTSREQEVLELLARGMQNSQIAKALFVSTSTVKVHIRHIYDKLGVNNRTEATSRHGLFG